VLWQRLTVDGIALAICAVALLGAGSRCAALAGDEMRTSAGLRIGLAAGDPDGPKDGESAVFGLAPMLRIKFPDDHGFAGHRRRRICTDLTAFGERPPPGR